MNCSDNKLLRNNGTTLVTVGVGLLTDERNIKVGTFFIITGVVLILIETYLSRRRVE